MPRWRSLHVLLAAACLVLALPAKAEYPDRPIRLIMPYAAGAGAMDLAARLMAEKLTARLGSPVIVVNQPGAAGTIAAAATARGPKDGYTLYFGASSALGYPRLINKDLSYDPQKDFSPIAMLGTVPVAFFVNGASSIRTVQDLVAAAKARPGELTFGSPGVGTATHIAIETFMARTDIRMRHVPYGSNANYWVDLMGGQLDVVTAGITGGLGLARDGKLRMIATATRTRTSIAPDVPAVGELVPGYDAPAWMGLVVAQGTPEPVIAKLERAVMDVFSEPSTATELAKAGIDVAPLDRKAFAARMAADYVVWEATLKGKSFD